MTRTGRCPGAANLMNPTHANNATMKTKTPKATKPKTQWKFEITSWVDLSKNAVNPQYGVRGKHPVHTKGAWVNVANDKELFITSDRDAAVAEVKRSRERFKD